MLWIQIWAAASHWSWLVQFPLPPEALLLLSFIPDSACMMRSSMSEPSAVIYKMHKYITTAGNRKPLRKEGVKKAEDNVLFQCSDLMTEDFLETEWTSAFVFAFVECSEKATQRLLSLVSGNLVKWAQCLEMQRLCVQKVNKRHFPDTSRIWESKCLLSESELIWVK